ncbi:MAG: adenylate/guanylate cyclase domain-containing protein [Pseudanabaenaceae cyanobacterium]
MVAADAAAVLWELFPLHADPLWTVVDGCYGEVNAGFCRVLGYSATEIQGRPLTDLALMVSPPMAPPGTLRDYPLWFRTRYGQVRCLRYSEFDLGDRLLCLACEDPKDLPDPHADLLAAIADNFPGLIYRTVLHADGTVTIPYLSTCTEDVFGLSVNDIVLHLEWVFDLVHPEDRQTLMAAVESSIVDLQPFDCEYRLPMCPTRWVRLFARPFRTPLGDTVWDGAIVNITPQKEVEVARQQLLEVLADKHRHAERLLQNIFPAVIVERLSTIAPGDELDYLRSETGTEDRRGRKPAIADRFADATILFADIVGFTELAARISATDLVGLLNRIFSLFDRLCDRYGLEKIKTIGDAYMVAGGVPLPRPDHTEAIADMALALQQQMQGFHTREGLPVAIRCGIDRGSVVAGIVGTKKIAYDLWGDTVNVASRMESQGEPGKIQVSEAVYQRLCPHYHLEKRGTIFIKGKGTMTTYWLLGRKDSCKLV